MTVSPRAEPRPAEDPARLAALAEEHGEAFYLVDVERFKGNYEAFADAFLHHYDRVDLAYSYKTNYLPVLCRSVARFGGLAEVVSELEYALARRLGVEPEGIIFNGPYKSRTGLAVALSEGAIVNLDSLSEVERVTQIASGMERPVQIGLRCNIALPDESPSRFGVSLSGGDFSRAIERLRAERNCQLRGIHCHVLTRRRSASDYQAITGAMLDAAVTHLEPAELEFVDLGGGFYSSMPPDLRRQFNGDIPTFEEYGAAIAGGFAERFGREGGPRLILEPGISITADVMRFVARVQDLKRVGHAEYALVAGSVYDVKPTKTPRQLPMRVVRATGLDGRSSVKGPVDVVGYTCMEDDVLYRGYDGPMAPGDFVVFSNVGAYTLVLKPPFIMPASPVLSVDSELNVLEVARRPEELRDVFASYAL